MSEDKTVITVALETLVRLCDSESGASKEIQYQAAASLADILIRLETLPDRRSPSPYRKAKK